MATIQIVSEPGALIEIVGVVPVPVVVSTVVEPLRQIYVALAAYEPEDALVKV